MLSLGHRFQQINKRLIRFSSLGRKARNDVAKIRAIKRSVLIDLSREEPFTKRTERNEADAELLERRQHCLFWFSPLQRVFTLKRGHWMDCVCPTDGLHSCFREPEVLDLTFLNQVLHGSGHVLDWHRRINAMLIEQIDRIDLESPERCFGDLLDVFRPAICARLPSVSTKLETEFGGDHYLIANGSERFAHEFFVCERAVRFSSIEKRYAAFYRRPNQRDHFLLVCRRTIAIAHSHATEPESRHFEVAISEFAFLHCCSPFAP